MSADVRNFVARVRNFVARVRNFAALVRNFAADSRLVRRWKCGELTAAQRAICHAALDFVRFVLFGAGPLETTLAGSVRIAHIPVGGSS